MKKILGIVFAMMAVMSFAGCVDHDDGVCDKKGCDRTFGVVRYNKNTELCIEHAIEAGLADD